ncbi:MAG: glycosyltransferase, partial [Oligoflexia bacterium]|nr:glycosyltransferase [Oligoflexia bacterium]
KDHATLLRAFKVYLDYKIQGSPQAHLLLVGKDMDLHNCELNNLISELGISDYVSLTGESKSPELMPCLDIFVLSSIGEGLPNVLGEAMSCGIPCISTNVGDAAKLLNGLGIVVEPSNPKALAEAMKDFTQTSKEKMDIISVASRKHIIDNYSPEGVVRQYTSLYNQLLE